ncbi:MAG: hypothetical protein U9R69_09215, partial [Thermodesulfobacteriota bacterium]|nr:hypothetical protein [Thermodesulfobacteriota bacterium]
MERSAAILARNFYFSVDIVLTSMAFFLAYQAKLYLPGAYSGLSQTFNYPVILLLLIFFAGPCYHAFLLYQPGRHLDLLRIFASIFKATLVIVALTLLALYLSHQSDISRLLLVLFSCFNIIFLFSVRVVRTILHRCGWVQSRHLKEILIIGSHERAKDLIRYLHSASYSGYNMIGCLEIGDQYYHNEVAEGVRVIGTMSDFRGLLSTR